MFCSPADSRLTPMFSISLGHSSGGSTRQSQHTRIRSLTGLSGQVPQIRLGAVCEGKNTQPSRGDDNDPHEQELWERARQQDYGCLPRRQ